MVMTVADKKADGWIEDLVGALCDPIIVYNSEWKESLPDRIKNQITLERLVMNMKVMHEGGVPVGDTEAMAYIFPRTMDAPITEQWMRIYSFCFNQAMTFMKVEIPEDLKSGPLSEYDLYQLNHLKHWIYQQRVKYRKEKQRGERREAKGEAEAKELTTVPAQPSFF
jgi:hypothetical protein